MKKTILSLCAILLCTLAFAQGSILTVFSEDGHKFYLILNGQRQNEKPETNIRVEGLTQPFYNCKILFDDKTLGEVNKTNLPVVDAETKSLQNVTYKIKSAKDGKQVLRFFSNVPIEPNAPPVRPAGVAVYSFGNPAPVVSETTTTVVQTTSANGGSVNMNAGGVGMNVNVTIPADMAGTTTTTTTTTSSSSSAMAQPAQVATPASGCVGYAMAPGDFESAKGSVKEASFEDTKLSTAKQIAGSNCLYASQVAEVCRLFGFEATKLDFAKYCYRRCIDPQNYFKINPVFDYDASKSELSKYTSSH